MRILAVTSEMQPLVKTGGLADVSAALPRALNALGAEVTTLLPGYPAVMKRVEAVEEVKAYPELFGSPARLLTARFDSLDLFVLDAPAFFQRDGGPYCDPAGLDWPDNWRRFAALSAVGADIAGGAVGGYRPDLVHAHDWQAAMTLAYMRYGAAAAAVPAVMTVHNLAFQGQFPVSIFPELGLPAAAYAVDGVEYYGGVGFLKGGLHCAKAITTVSPTYAEEIITPDRGMGLHGLLRSRVDRLHGIVNGIDVDEWNPATDPYLAQPYSLKTLAKRQANREALAQRFKLESAEGPIFCVVSRLTEQKGIDLIGLALDHLVARGGKLVVIGSGEPRLERLLRAGAGRHPGRVGIVIGYDESVSHLMQGGADAILIPSRFEPCGLTQLYGLRYGCVPVVARTGGLADTVIHANEAAIVAGVATGVQFLPTDLASLRLAIGRAITLFRQPEIWSAMQRQGMKADFSWGRSAGRYVALFNALVAEARV